MVILKLILPNINYPNVIVFTTYHSANKLLEYKFDLKIGDEAHHLTEQINTSKKKFSNFHNITAEYTLYMTATLNGQGYYKMSDDKMFGNIVDTKSIQLGHRK